MRFQVAGYSEGLWCIVDNNDTNEGWPRQVQYHDATGWKTVFKSREEAAQVAARLNQWNEKHRS